MTSLIVSQIITDSYTEARCDSSNVLPVDAIRYCDDTYQELIDEKKLINEDFVKKSATLATRPYVNKYALPTDFEKMKQISVRYTVPTYTARAAWTAYVAGDKCTYNGKSYVCSLAHTSWPVFENTKTYTTSAIMTAGDTITINGETFTAKAVGACANPWDFYIGLAEAWGNLNLYNCINSLTAWSATTFIALNEYQKEKFAQAEIVATNPTNSTVVITSNDNITTSENCSVGSRSSETGGNRVQIFESYKPCTQRTIDFDFVNDFNNISESQPIYFYENNNLVIYPQPTVAVTQGILFDYIPVVDTLTLTTDDRAILMEDKLYDAWIKGTAKLFTDHMGKDSSKLQMEYIEGTQKCKNRWKTRHYSPIGEQLPSSLYRYMR